MSNQSQARLIEPLQPALRLDQARLNVSDRTRTSRLAWRGQFSPELVEYLMQEVCDGAEVYFDPFAGSGTVLYEALKHGKSAKGLEVNPAAWHLAVLASFGRIAIDEQFTAVRAIRELRSVRGRVQALFEVEHAEGTADLIPADGPRAQNLALAASLLLGMGNKSEVSAEAVARGATAVLAVVEEVKTYGGKAECHLRDARSNGLDEASVDAVITSPPYINVFNYHQNYRPACELLGWKPLEAARSEIGANRKHRQNRFLTVVQYCIDMHDCLVETARTMRVGAPLVIVLGRTSNVLGTAFENGRIIEQLIVNSGCYSDVQVAERVFVSRFGESIFEDILIARRGVGKAGTTIDPRSVGLDALEKAMGFVPTRNKASLDEAISAAMKVQGSPILDIHIPLAFALNGN